MQVVWKEMTRDGAKSNLAKCNLIGGIQFTHVKNCPMFILCNDWVCSDWTWTLFLWYVMECKLFGGWVVSKGTEKTRFKLKILQKGWMRTFRPQSMRLSRRPQTIIVIKLAQNLWLMSLFVHSLLIPWHHLHENNSQTLRLVQNIQMLWYDWCEIIP